MQQIICSMLALFALSCACPAQGADFVTTAEINQASVHTSVYQQTGQFYADVSVKNVSKLLQKITVWTNHSWSWVTDSNDVATNQAALQNIAVIGTLKPGDTYRSRILMASDPKGKRPITFRLGFIPNTKRPVQNAHDPRLIWSNRVRLESLPSHSKNVQAAKRRKFTRLSLATTAVRGFETESHHGSG